MNRTSAGGRKPPISSGESSGTSGVLSSSIRRFKGLEAAVVIVTDIGDISTDEAQKLMYVAVTRPLSRLVLLMNAEGARQYWKLRSKK